jgi:glutamyl-tRNA synthetase
LRALSLDDYVHALVLYLGEQGYDWDAELVRKTAPLVQEKIARLGEYPAFAGFFFEEVEPDPAEFSNAKPMLEAVQTALTGLEPFTAEAIEAALRAAADALGLKPRQAFQPIRVAVTGSRISPGLFESIELLGREKALARLSRAVAS